jgi:hypothetical protein
VVVTELREGGNLVSAMFTGKKILTPPLADSRSAADVKTAKAPEEPGAARGIAD